MGMMQANATVGAWSACSSQGSLTRSKSPPPPMPADLEDGTGSAGASGELSAGSASGGSSGSGAKRVGSLTLPRGWRYHKSSGMFEHKRSGRMQWEPPLPAETGSPLHVLDALREPPCDDEERGNGCWDSGHEGGRSPHKHAERAHHSDSDSGSDGWHDSRKGRSRRSRTWAYTARPCAPSNGNAANAHQSHHASGERRGRTPSSASAPRPMSVWELHEALGEKGNAGGADAARRRSGVPHSYGGDYERDGRSRARNSSSSGHHEKI